MMTDEYESDVIKPSQMASESWCERHSDTIAKYVKLRVHGMLSIQAMRRAFGEDYYDSLISARVNALESTDHYQAEFQRQLTETPIDKLWNEKMAVNKLLTIANDMLDKGSTRLRAIQELNVLIGITIVDENGKTRKGSSMADFYKSRQQQTQQQEATSDQ